MKHTVQVSLVWGASHCSRRVKVPCSGVRHLQQGRSSGGENPQQPNSQQKFLQLVKGPSQKKRGGAVRGGITIAFMSLWSMSLQLLDLQHLTVPYTFRTDCSCCATVICLQSHPPEEKHTSDYFQLTFVNVLTYFPWIRMTFPETDSWIEITPKLYKSFTVVVQIMYYPSL